MASCFLRRQVLKIGRKQRSPVEATLSLTIPLVCKTRKSYIQRSSCRNHPSELTYPYQSHRHKINRNFLRSVVLHTTCRPTLTKVTSTKPLLRERVYHYCCCCCTLMKGQRRQNQIGNFSFVCCYNLYAVRSSSERSEESRLAKGLM